MDPQDIKLNRADRRAISRRNTRAAARLRHAQHIIARRRGTTREKMLTRRSNKAHAEYIREVSAVPVR